MENTVDKVINIALAEVGYLEKSKTAYQKNSKVLDSKEDGAGSDNYTKYGREMHEQFPKLIPFPSAWCDCFTDWCFYKAYGVTNAKALLAGDFCAYTVKSAQMYKDKNAWYTSNPQRGDQIFFKDDNGGICHTGLVIKIENGDVYTIEGNTSSANGMVKNGGCVRQKKYSLVYDKIAGYGRPKYDGSPETEVAPDAAKTEDWKDFVMELQKALNAEYDTDLPVNGIPDNTMLMATPTLSARTRNTKPRTVIAVQNILTHWGYICKPDGDFYSATEKMVKSFQREIIGFANPDGELTGQKRSWKALLKL